MESKTSTPRRCRCGRFSKRTLCARCDAREQRLFISYPVVFEAGNDPSIGNLRLPKNLRRHEAERVAAMVGALVIE